MEEDLTVELAEEAADLLDLMCRKFATPQTWTQFKESRIFLGIVDCYLY
jgi:hypothetical protein